MFLYCGIAIYPVLVSRFKGSRKRGELLLEYVCDRRVSTEQQLTGERWWVSGSSDTVYSLPMIES